jgi:hypothetical protein
MLSKRFVPFKFYFIESVCVVVNTQRAVEKRQQHQPAGTLAKPHFRSYQRPQAKLVKKKFSDRFRRNVTRDDEVSAAGFEPARDKSRSRGNCAVDDYRYSSFRAAKKDSCHTGNVESAKL